MERNRVYLIILVVVIAIVLLGMITVNTLFSRPPEVSVSGVSIDSINLSAICLNITFMVKNYYPVAIPVKTINYSVSYAGNDKDRVLGGGNEQGIRLEPGAHEISVPLNISNPEIIRSAWDVLKSREIRLQVNGTVTPDLFGLIPPVQYGREISVPVNAGSLFSAIGSILGS